MKIEEMENFTIAELENLTIDDLSLRVNELLEQFRTDNRIIPTFSCTLFVYYISNIKIKESERAVNC